MNCYIASQDRKYELPENVNKDNSLFFPETWMTTQQLAKTARPKDFHIVTDSHLLVGLYKTENVFYFDGKEWVNPNFQTYGSSYNLIIMKLWGITNTIPQYIVDGTFTNVMGSPL